MVVVVLGSGAPRLPGSFAHASQHAAWRGKVGSLLIPPEKSGEAGVAASSWKLEGPNRRPRGARRSQPLRTALGGRAEGGGKEVGRTVLGQVAVCAALVTVLLFASPDTCRGLGLRSV